MAHLSEARPAPCRKLTPALYLGLCSLGLFQGCCAPAARVATGVPAASIPRRGATLTRQLVADSAVELATRPLRTTAALALQSADTLLTATEGAVGKRLLLPLRKPPHSLSDDRAPLDPFLLERDLYRATRQELQSAEIRLYTDGPASLAVLEGLIDAAVSRIDVIMFIWENGPLGWAVAQRLAERAAHGVFVRVLIDGGGNLLYTRQDGEVDRDVNAVLAWLAGQPNIEVIRSRNGFGRFDHRKLVLIDGRVAWTGGRNFADRNFFQCHDVVFTVSGPLTADLSREFEESWEENGGRRGAAREQELTHPPTANALARVVGTGPLRYDLAATVTRAIAHAQHHIYVENPYLADSRIVLGLIQARRRGVDVRVVTTLHSGVPVMNRANRVTVNCLLRAGVRVYLDPAMTHIKAMAVDGCWAYLGTGNFDPLSMRHDYEQGLAISAGPLIQEVEQALLLPRLRPEWEVCEPLELQPGDHLAELAASLLF